MSTSYCPLPMKCLDIGRLVLRGAGGFGTVVAMVTCALLLGACHPTGRFTSATGKPDSHRPPSYRGHSSGRAPDLTDMSQQVVTAWLSAQSAFETAALSSDPDEPDLSATTVSPQIEWTTSLLKQMRAAGEVSRGVMRFSTPTVASISPRLATVTACGHDAEVVVSAQTGRPVPGLAGQVDFEHFVSTMELTDTGWKLATQSIGVGPCQRS
jgi:hypothetical protein